SSGCGSSLAPWSSCSSSCWLPARRAARIRRCSGGRGPPTPTSRAGPSIAPCARGNIRARTSTGTARPGITSSTARMTSPRRCTSCARKRSRRGSAPRWRMRSPRCRPSVTRWTPRVPPVPPAHSRARPSMPAWLPWNLLSTRSGCRTIAFSEPMKAGRCFAQAVAVLAVFAAARSFGLLGPAAISVSLLTAALALIAWSAGATRADLGLARTDMRAGLLYGAGAFGAVLLVLVVAAVIPATNGFLHDSRAQIDGGRLLYKLVTILLLTAIPEEFAFRGVLLGSALRLWGPWRASLITSALFGLWHIAPTLHTMSDNREFTAAAALTGGQVLLVSGSVAVTFLDRLVSCGVRPRPGSLIAPVMAHVAPNGLALPVAWFAVH